MGYMYVVLTKLAPDDLKHMVKFTNGASLEELNIHYLREFCIIGGESLLSKHPTCAIFVFQ